MIATAFQAKVIINLTCWSILIPNSDCELTVNIWFASGKLIVDWLSEVEVIGEFHPRRRSGTDEVPFAARIPSKMVARYLAEQRH